MDFSNTTITLTGPRVTLRILDDSHANVRYAGWLNDPEVNRFLATKGATVPELREYIAKKHAQHDALFFGVFLKENDLFIGTVKLEPIEPEQKRATIAVMIGDKEFWGKGYAAEAMGLLCDWCFAELQLEEMNLGVVAKNLSAIRAYQKLGFKETKRDLNYIQYGDEMHDQVWMALRPSQAQDDKIGNSL